MATPTRSASGAKPDIVVDGYSPRFRAAVNAVLRHEGGFNDIAADRGGATNFGISLRFLVDEGKVDLDNDGWADFDADRDGDIDKVDVRKLTRGDAVFLYHRCFWSRERCEELPPPIGEMLFDQAVNSGAGNAKRMLQRAINRAMAGVAEAPPGLVEDRVIGPRTRIALDFVLSRPSIGMPVLVAAFRRVVADRYREIAALNPSQRIFLKGWLRRADALGRGVELG